MQSKHTVVTTVLVAALAVGPALTRSALGQDPKPPTLDVAPGRQETPQRRTPVREAERLSHLDEAKRILDSVSGETIKGPAAEHLAAVARNFSELVTHYEASQAALKAQQTPAIESIDSQQKVKRADWKQDFSEIEHNLTYLIGGGPAEGSASGDRPIGTNGTLSVLRAADSSRGVKDLPHELRQKLEEFRRELELFYVQSRIDLSPQQPQ